MIEAISTALASVKMATLVIKSINDLNVDVEVKTKTSELLTTIIDIQNAMLEVQSKLAESQIENQDLKKKISELQEDSTKKLMFKRPFYWQDGDDTPFCPTCWEADRAKIHLEGPKKGGSGKTYYKCNVCQNIIYQ